jgi:ketosteroid isomerase-like protein
MADRLREALNSHDPARVAGLVAEAYVSAQPAHPGRAFTGRAQVLENWTEVFRGVPDFTATLVDSCADGDTEWAEWDWRGTHTDGSAFAMSGVTVLMTREGLITEARLFMEPVDASGDDIDTAVQELYQPPA